MQIGMFRRNVAKTVVTKQIKTALRTVSKNTGRVQVVSAAVRLKLHTGQLLQSMGQYLLGAQFSQEMKDHAFIGLGDVGADLTALARALKVKLPSSTKKIKLTGTRGAALLQLDSLTTDLLAQAEQGLFASPQMTTVKKLVTLPQKGGVKEERNVDVVNTEAEAKAEETRQTAMKSFLSGAIDVYWRLCWDITGQPPAGVLDAKFGRMKADYPGVAFDTEKKKTAKAVAAKKGAPKKKAKSPAVAVPA